ncbi:hypothetical protein [Bdellovibrio svalbardensis]|uniref:Lipoprotein n=1 Tax=Bdellovibrio svalbardensis TaxID=2972972 RepID=A0ABT6DIF8_9BACT|nr:hypothetical protein [Bdellovibrio svalbardensis]MDG0815641.1 hypothetical protein [Bdellovibrio svalbardensis]
MIMRILLLAGMFVSCVGCASLKKAVTWGDPTKSDYIMDAPMVTPEKTVQLKKSRNIASKRN